MSFIVKVDNYDLKSPDIDVNTQFFFDKGLVGVEAFGIIQLLLLFKFPDDFFNKFFRFAFSLDKGQDMVDIVGNDILFINKVNFLDFLLFANYMNFFISRKNFIAGDSLLLQGWLRDEGFLCDGQINLFIFGFGDRVNENGVGECCQLKVRGNIISGETEGWEVEIDNEVILELR